MLAPPQICLCCRQPVARSLALCHECEAALPWQPLPCERCGVSLTGDSSLCAGCQLSPPCFDVCLPVFAYEAPVSTMIRHCKDQAGFSAARCLGQLLAAAFQQYYHEQDLPLPALLVPVPLHRARLQRRGFNQAALLATEIRRRTRIPLALHVCERLPSVHSQRGLSAAERHRNMENMFRAGRQAQLTAGRHIAIIDDVVTTTATVNALAHALREQTALRIERIDVWCVARTN